jgi:His-Xaa-Ser system protein HxsD
VAEAFMSDIKVIFGEGAVELEFDEGLYPKDAVYGAAYIFIDRCWVHLDRAGDKRIKVTLKGKSGAVDSQALAGEFQNEILGQAWRRLITEENRQLIESITTRALGGAAGPPGLDELLAMDIGDASAFEDPLGIAMSWEEKYTKKKGATKPGEDEGASADAPPPQVKDGGA